MKFHTTFFCAAFRRWAVVAVACGLGWGAGASGLRHEAGLHEEAEVKAVLLYNFAHFVEWPAGAFAEPDAPLVIGILGYDPFGRALDELVEHETVDGHRIEVVRFRDAGKAASSHLLFISSSERGASGSILKALRGRPILTVADFDHFLERGGVVQLYRGANNKVRLRVNLAAAREASLTLSAKLLRVADTVQPQ